MPIDFARLYAQESLMLAKAARADELEGDQDFVEADRHGHVFVPKHSRGERGATQIKSQRDIDARWSTGVREAGTTGEEATEVSPPRQPPRTSGRPRWCPTRT